MPHNTPADIIFALILPTTAGYAIITSLLGNRSTFTERISLAYPTGLSLLSIIMFNLGWATIPLTVTPVIAALAAITAIAYKTIAKNKVKILNIKTSVLSEYMELPNPIKAIVIAILAWIALKIFLNYVAATAMPAWSPDSKYTWTVRSLIFYSERGLHLTPDNFFIRTVGQPTYPLFSQMNQVWLAIIHGSFDKTVVKMWAPGFMITMALFAYATARKGYGIIGSLIAALLAISAPLAAIHTTEPYSDFPLAFFYTAALVFFWRHMQNPERTATAAACGMFTAFAINTKLEGAVFAAILTAIFAIWVLRQSAARQRLSSMAAYTAPFLLIAPYYIFRIANAIGFHQTYMESRHADGLVPLSQLRIFPLLFSYLFLPDNIGLMATIGFCIILYLHIKSKLTIPHLYYAIAVPACYILFLLALYTFSAPHKDFLESATVFYRNMMALYPIALFLVFTIHRNMLQTGQACQSLDIWHADR